jgi:hypothetical protein
MKTESSDVILDDANLALVVENAKHAIVSAASIALRQVASEAKCKALDEALNSRRLHHEPNSAEKDAQIAEVTKVRDSAGASVLLGERNAELAERDKTIGSSML